MAERCMGKKLKGTNPDSRQTGCYYALVALSTVQMLNLADRFVPNAVKVLIKKDLNLTDTDTALPNTGMTVVMMVTASAFGYLCDKEIIDRRVILASAVVFWSLATGLAGYSMNLMQLILYRSLVGVGEAAYTTIAPPMISDFFPLQDRSWAYAAFALAGPVGGAVGFGAGAVLGSKYGWRFAFLACGAPGLIAALACLRLNDPVRGINDSEKLGGKSKRELDTTLDPDDEETLCGVECPPGSFMGDVCKILSNKRWLGIVTGQTACAFATGCLTEWYATYLLRYNGCTLAQSGIVVGAVTIIGSIAGILIGLKATQFFEKKIQSAAFLVCGCFMLPAAVFMSLAVNIEQNKDLAYLYLLLAEIFVFTYQAPMSAAAISVMHSSLRARASGIQILILHVFGDVLSPPLVGYVSDVTGSLKVGMQLAWIALLAASFYWFCSFLFLSPLPVADEGHDGKERKQLLPQTDDDVE